MRWVGGGIGRVGGFVLLVVLGVLGANLYMGTFAEPYEISITGILISGLFIYVGIYWIRGRTPGR
jgi:hypothetical protein